MSILAGIIEQRLKALEQEKQSLEKAQQASDGKSPSLWGVHNASALRVVEIKVELLQSILDETARVESLVKPAGDVQG